MGDYYQNHLHPLRKAKRKERGSFYHPRIREGRIPHPYYLQTKKRLIEEPRSSLIEKFSDYSIQGRSLDRGYIDVASCLSFRMRLFAEMEHMGKDIEILDSRLAAVEGSLEQELEIKDVPLGKARIAVEKFLKGYLEQHSQIYPSDVADELGLRYELVREVFDSLETEGKLKRRGE